MLVWIVSQDRSELTGETKNQFRRNGWLIIIIIRGIHLSNCKQRQQRATAVSELRYPLLQSSRYLSDLLCSSLCSSLYFHIPSPGPHRVSRLHFMFCCLVRSAYVSDAPFRPENKSEFKNSCIPVSFPIPTKPRSKTPLSFVPSMPHEPLRTHKKIHSIAMLCPSCPMMHPIPELITPRQKNHRKSSYTQRKRKMYLTKTQPNKGKRKIVHVINHNHTKEYLKERCDESMSDG
jgi:hypothetical protein